LGDPAQQPEPKESNRPGESAWSELNEIRTAAHGKAKDLTAREDLNIQAKGELEALLNRKGYFFVIGPDVYYYGADRKWEELPGWLSGPPHIYLYESGSWDGRAIPGYPDFVQGAELEPYLTSLADYRS
jgi:hypothetical protein